MATRDHGEAQEQEHEHEDKGEHEGEHERQGEGEEHPEEAKRRRDGEEEGGSSHPAPGAALIEAGEAIVEHEAPSLSSMLNDILITRVLFYIDRSDLLLAAAVLSKSMNSTTKSDMLWRLTITEPHDKSAMIILASPEHHNVLKTGVRMASPVQRTQRTQRTRGRRTVGTCGIGSTWT